ncbi:hypothetical protein [Nonomuraea longicatena]|uniref:hypothetical protein n=1 Tax=Nonomuraea longicatena TaxID=83682 RepID=UPI0031D758B6
MDERGLRQIQENADFAVARLGPLSDVEFGLNAASVEWVMGFIERRRTRPDAQDLDVLVAVLGSFLGACIVAATGGNWHRVDGHGWGVRLPCGSTAFPFAKVHKQLLFGTVGGDSIAGFYLVRRQRSGLQAGDEADRPA